MISRYNSDDAAGKMNFNIFTVFPQVQNWLSYLFSEKKGIEKVAILNASCSSYLQLQNY